jgi:uncharacterized oxidoreductase
MTENRKTILITGGTAGIGLALARQLLDRGGRVLVTGRNEQRLKTALAAVPGLEGVASDVTRDEDRVALKHWIEQSAGGLDVMVNNAGIGEGYLFAEADAAQKAIREIETNLTAPLQLTHELLPLLRRPGMIVNVTSGFALYPCAATPGYSASKAGFSAFTHVLREQMKVYDKTVHVMEACPPMVDTGIVQLIRCRKITPEQAATAIRRGMERRAERVLIGSCRVLEPLRRFLPGLTRRIVNRWPISIYEDPRPQV